MSYVERSGNIFVNLKAGKVLFPAIVDAEKIDGYYVDLSGNIWSSRQGGLKMMSHKTKSNGYPSLSFKCSKRFADYKEHKRTLQIHRIVAETLVPFDPFSLDICPIDWQKTPKSVQDIVRCSLIVNHKDHNRENWHPSNLEWTNSKGNSRAYQNHKNNA
jgi:hypothetical protein